MVKASISHKILTAKETSKIFDVHVNTIRRWIKKGDLPASKVGGNTSRWMIKIEDIDRIINKGAK